MFFGNDMCAVPGVMIPMTPRRMPPISSMSVGWTQSTRCPVDFSARLAQSQGNFDIRARRSVFSRPMSKSWLPGTAKA